METKVLSCKNIIAFILIVGIIILSIYSLDILMMLFGSFVITCAISPLVNKMEKKMPRIWAVTLLLFLMILATSLIIVPLVTICAREAVQMINNFPSSMAMKRRKSLLIKSSALLNEF